MKYIFHKNEIQSKCTFELLKLETNNFPISFEQICSIEFNYGIKLSSYILKYAFVKLIIKL